MRKRLQNSGQASCGDGKESALASVTQRTGRALAAFGKKVHRGFIALFSNEKHSKWFVPVFSILLSLVISFVLIASYGKNPFDALVSIFQGAGILPRPNKSFLDMLSKFLDMLELLAPMLFAALAVCIAYKAGLFNIGVSGQMLAGGFVASLFGYMTMPAGLHQIVVLIFGVVTGAAVAGLVGLLKYKFNINEVVSCIMLNYIVLYLVNFFTRTYFLDPASGNRLAQTVNESARLTFGFTAGGVEMGFPFALVLALAAVFLLRLFLNKTKAGFEIQAVGKNKKAAKYAGMNVGKNVILAMLISGMLAGLAGVSMYLGATNRLPRGETLPATGFDAIAVSLLGASNPVGIIFSALLITVMNTGASWMLSKLSVPTEIVSIMIALMLLFAACGEFFKYLARRSTEKAALKAPVAGEAEKLPAESGGEPPPDIGEENGGTREGGEPPPDVGEENGGTRETEEGENNASH